MGRNRTPDDVLAVRGGYKDNRKRLEKRLGQVVPMPPVGPPPEWLHHTQKDAWKYIVDRAPEGVLTRQDEPALILASVLLAAIQHGDNRNSTRAQFQSLLAKFGMLPADRNKVAAAPKKKTNKFADLEKGETK